MRGIFILANGSGFTGATAVKFNGVDALIFTVDSDTVIRATFPATFANDSLVVTTPGGDINVTDYIISPLK